MTVLAAAADNVRINTESMKFIHLDSGSGRGTGFDAIRFWPRTWPMMSLSLSQKERLGLFNGHNLGRSAGSAG